ncbi:MAG: hypothetical protein AB7G93_22195 [Bdellovibrionales bacterium]
MRNVIIVGMALVASLTTQTNAWADTGFPWYGKLGATTYTLNGTEGVPWFNSQTTNLGRLSLTFTEGLAQ